MVVHPQLSSSNPSFSKPRNETANSDFWSRLTHQLLGRLKSTIPNLKIYLPKKVNSEKLGLGIDNPCRIVLLSLRMNKCLGRVNNRHFFESWSLQLRNDTKMSPPTQEFFFFFIVTSIVYGVYGYIKRRSCGFQSVSHSEKNRTIFRQTKNPSRRLR